MTSYLCVLWRHDHSDEPVLLCSELDDARWETRKVEIYADGRMMFADALRGSGSTELSVEPLPTEEEIAADVQFEIVPYSKAEFESAWAEATRARVTGQ
jgi:hypothetical protein